MRRRRRFPEPETQLLGRIAEAKCEAPGSSPVRADAIVWGLTELMLGTQAEPRVWRR